jgi:hypothetical protein
MYRIGEIYSVEAYLIESRKDIALVKVHYFIAPYIKIDPEKVVFHSGFYENLKKNHPAQVAEVRYLFIRKAGKEEIWSSVHFSPSTEKIINQLYPRGEIPGLSQEIRIRTKYDKNVPEKLLKPVIQ